MVRRTWSWPILLDVVQPAPGLGACIRDSTFIGAATAPLSTSGEDSQVGQWSCVVGTARGEIRARDLSRARVYAHAPPSVRSRHPTRQSRMPDNARGVVQSTASLLIDN